MLLIIVAIASLLQVAPPMKYVCPDGSISCSSLNDVLQVSDDGSRICDGNDISCSALNDLYQASSDRLHVCPGEDISCSVLNDVYQSRAIVCTFAPARTFRVQSSTTCTKCRVIAGTCVREAISPVHL